jgi:hypothetical protein
MSFDPQSKKPDPMRCIDQAATAVAALHAGFAIMPLSITAPRSDGWRYRDEIAAHVDVEKLADRRWLVAMLGAGSTAQHIFAGLEQPVETFPIEAAPEGPLPVKEFVIGHLREIERVARALFERGDLTPEDVKALLAQSE